MEPGVFLSYRRADTSGHAGRISDGLVRHFGRVRVFRDIDAIAAGSDFVQALERAISAAKVCLVLIGDTWLDARSVDGERRLDRSDDPVRREVELALAHPELTILPVLLEGAAMPAAEDLPESIRPLARLQAVELSESRWEYDMAHLVRVLQAAGVQGAAAHRMPRWVVPVLAAMAALLLALGLWCWQGRATADDYLGLWHMPNGNYWSVRAKDEGFWVEETHHESRQVWKRGPAELSNGKLDVRLMLVFDRDDTPYLHQLQLSDDRQSLIGTVRRADRDSDLSLVLTRSAH
ncbi:MAG: toll/interleukin-1 receptor domain-containing protein [Gammaproteobacteria bacterium]|nr:toll/interleukin-1 receptor domain-containing protein [Gammaproteobacteria bacterium]